MALENVEEVYSQYRVPLSMLVTSLPQDLILKQNWPRLCPNLKSAPTFRIESQNCVLCTVIQGSSSAQ